MYRNKTGRPLIEMSIIGAFHNDGTCDHGCFWEAHPGSEHLKPHS